MDTYLNTSALIKPLLTAACIAALLVGCSPPDQSTDQSTDTKTYSSFGPYQELADWSDWCPVNADTTSCEKILTDAVTTQTSSSRPTVRAHGWKLWAGIIAPLDNTGYDLPTNTSTYSGTTGCWSSNLGSNTACSGVYPIWYSWPNTGLPFLPLSTSTTATPIASSTATPSGLLKINHNFGVKDQITASLGATQTSGPDPTHTQTVDTNAPTYQLPPLTLVNQCGLLEAQVKAQLKIAYNLKSSATQVFNAWSALDTSCTNAGFSGVVCPINGGICDGSTFVNQGDVMIASESLSQQAWDAVQTNKLYGTGTDTALNKLYEENDANKAATAIANMFIDQFISTKHMYWPVKGCKPGSTVGDLGCRIRYGALPPWVPANFKQYSYATNADYLGYEQWSEVVAIDTCVGASGTCPTSSSATLALHDVFNVDTVTKTKTAHSSITTNSPDVYDVSKFVHIQVSQEVLDKLSATDKALLDQATLWAYGTEAKGFEAGDFLVVAAMHVTTKEIYTWAFQSVWWSPMNDSTNDCSLTSYNNCFGQSDVYKASSAYSGLSSEDRNTLDGKVGSVWQDNYLMTDSYGINYEIDGTKADIDNYFTTVPNWAKQTATGSTIAQLPVSMNVYIEPVIHPIGSNCQNCHRRAGYISNAPTGEDYAGGVGRANYQNAQCPSLLGDYGMPSTDACMTKPWAWNSSAWGETATNNCTTKNDNATPQPTLCINGATEAYPLVNTDFAWFVADQHVQEGAH